MNPKVWTHDNRPVVWTVSLDVPDTYCLYVHGVMIHENLTFDEFCPVYKNAVEANR